MSHAIGDGRAPRGRSTVRACLSAVLLAAVTGAPAQALETVLDGLEVSGDLSARYEGVDDRLSRPADALTLRTRLAVQSVSAAGFTGLLEFTDTRVVGGIGDYAPRRPEYAVVADPPLTRLNRAVLEYRSASGASAALGRQRIVLDNARFVGNVGWRQSARLPLRPPA